MLFDELASLVENNRDVFPPDVERIVRAARVFTFKEKDLSPDVLSPDVEHDEQDMFLPFPTVAIENIATRGGDCVICWDDIDEDARGLRPLRNFLVYENYRTNADQWTDYRTMERERRELLKRTSIVFGGGIGWATPENGNNAHFEIHHASMFLDKRFEGHPGEDQMKPKGIAQRIAISIMEILALNSPDRFILEKTLLSESRPKYAYQIPRSHQRPLYTLIRPHAARAAMGLPEPTGHHKCPHERRAHERTLRADCWTHAKGRVIKIAATWIGPHEAIVGNKRYRVLLDR